MKTLNKMTLDELKIIIKEKEDYLATLKDCFLEEDSFV